MTTQHDDEIRPYRARVDQISERPEATPERAAMLPELLIECRVNLGTILGIAGEDSDFGRLAWRTGQLIDRIGSGITALNETNERLRTVIAERDATIARLRSVITSVVDNPTITYREAERRFLAALAGEEAPE